MSVMLDFRNWSTETWTALATVLAFVALIQPWLLGAWRRLYKRGTVDIHETGKIEIGYSGFGATVGIMGTLRARDCDKQRSRWRKNFAKTGFRWFRPLVCLPYRQISLCNNL